MSDNAWLGGTVTRNSGWEYPSGAGNTGCTPLVHSSDKNPFCFDVSLSVPDLQSRDRMGAFKELIDRLYLTGCVTDGLRFLQGVLDREDQQSTALGGYGVALPHARCRSVAHASLAIGISRNGIVFPGEQHLEPVHVICMLAVPDAVPVAYLSLLGRLAFCFQQTSFYADLLACTAPSDIHRLVSRSVAGFQNAPATGVLSFA